MPANWAAFTAQITKFFNDKKAKDVKEAADAIATEYDLAMKTALTMPPALNAFMGSDKTKISSGFEKSFQALFDKGDKPPTPADFMDAANGIIQYWQNASFNPMPAPPPAVGPAPGKQPAILNPGLPPPLAAGIMDAMGKGQAPAVAAALVAEFTKHMMSIQGMYTGMVPSPAGPVPTPFPFVGIG